MNRLEELLGILDRQERLQALAKYARSLGIDIEATRNKAKQYNEERLVVLIFDALKNKRSTKKQNTHFIAASLALLIAGGVLLSRLPYIMTALYEEERAAEVHDSKMMQGFDKDGQPVATEDGQPVLFKMMDGPYKDYDDNGKLRAIHYYENGAVVRIKKFNAQGQLISDEATTVGQSIPGE